jgi:hypothetical protein
MSYQTQNENVWIPRSPDVVTVLWNRNPLQHRAPRTIVDSAVIGSADPCNRTLRNGQKFVCAEDCLLDNGFEKVFEEKLGSVFGLAVFVRQS